MNQQKRLMFFLVLNFIVSAAATATVLWLWERSHPSMPLPAAYAALPTSTVQSQPLGSYPTQAAPAPAAIPTSLPNGQMPVLITVDNVFGVGNLQDEYVLLKRQGEGELSLTNWVMDDGSGNVYTFPDLTLLPNASVQVHTGVGSDSVTDLFWGRDAAVWKEGKIVSLLDDQGRLRATYLIP
ncbi:MAG: lamin tail domain-containing protein [Chloroflexi bacterium]|nr:lamin tail domain-containing protein [Chloroflexota bacterium]